MNLSERLEGVFFSPKQTSAALAEKPVWVDALVILLILIAVFSLLVSPYALKDRLAVTKDSVKLQERLGEERFKQYIERMENPNKTASFIQTAVGMPLMFFIGLLFSSLILMVMGRFGSTQGTYRQVLAALVHANFVDKFLGNAVRLLLIFLRKSTMQASTGLAFLFPKMEAASPAYVILSQVDFFQIWMFGIVGYAISSIFKVNLKKGLFISYSFWLLKSLIYIAFGIIGLHYVR